MKEKELRRSLSVLSIGTVIRLTYLTARQIRYYDAKGLIFPKRSPGNCRLYSLDDVDKILEIKDYLKEGMAITDIKRVYEKQYLRKVNKNKTSAYISDKEVRASLKKEFMQVGRYSNENDNEIHFS